MKFSDEQVKALSAKLDASSVRGRSQGGRTVSYIEGWHAIAEANRIFGYGGWNRETVELRQLGNPYKNAKDNCVVNYACKVRVTVGDVVREGCGFGSGIDKDEGQAHESAIKEAETDAMKRCLMTFGNPFGLALYDKSQEGVDRTPVKPVEQPKDVTPERADTWIAKAKDHAKKFTDAAALTQWTQSEGYRNAIATMEADFPDKATAFKDWLTELKETLPAKEAA
jgi:DNA repair and recombination protein RAD52